MKYLTVAEIVISLEKIPLRDLIKIISILLSVEI